MIKRNFLSFSDRDFPESRYKKMIIERTLGKYSKVGTTK